MLIALSIGCAFAVTAWIARPVFVHARSQPETVTARVERHQEIIELLASTVAASIDVLGVHPRGTTPYAEIVLRTHGEGELIEAGEILVISHSRILQTVTFYVHDGSSGDEPTFYHREQLSRQGFTDRWRGDPEVTPRVMATGLLDMQVGIEPPEQATNAGSAGLLRLALTWAPDSADGMDEASVLVVLRGTKHESLMKEE